MYMYNVGLASRRSKIGSEAKESNKVDRLNLPTSQ